MTRDELKHQVWAHRRSLGLTLTEAAHQIGISANALKRFKDQAAVKAAAWLGVVWAPPSPPTPCKHAWKAWDCGCSWGNCGSCHLSRVCTRCGQMTQGAVP